MNVGCSKNELHNAKADLNTKERSQIFYFGEGKEWFGTVTISKVKTSYFESLYIQHIIERSTTGKEQQASKNVGKIEYVLNLGNHNSTRSSYPQALQGIGSFHVATEINAETFDLKPSDEITLEIKWADKKETIQLKKQE